VADGLWGNRVPVFFSILFLWVFEVQLLMQIIINRINVVVDDRSLIRKLKVSFPPYSDIQSRTDIKIVGNSIHHVQLLTL
jgi:hypothetical protein